MSADQLKVLFDTNVWLDLYLPGRPSAQASRDLLAFCVRKEAAVMFPLRSLADVYWQVLRDRKAWLQREYGELSEDHAHAANTDAWECVGAMMELGAPVGADVADVWYAQHMRHVHADFEDDMVLAAMDRAKADFLVTSDRQLIQKAPVPAYTPEDMLAYLNTEFDIFSSAF